VPLFATLKPTIVIEPLYDDPIRYKPKEIISVDRFIFLSIITFNLYCIWWQYKAWKIYQEREPRKEFMPAWRALFSVLFLYGLFRRNKMWANTVGYQTDYSSGWLFVGYLITTSCNSRPNYIWFIQLCSFLFFIQPFKALNYYLVNSGEYNVEFKTEFNTNQIILVVLGAALWLFEIRELLNAYLNWSI
jgi:hypothetical protein